MSLFGSWLMAQRKCQLQSKELVSDIKALEQDKSMKVYFSMHYTPT